MCAARKKGTYGLSLQACTVANTWRQSAVKDSDGYGYGI